jgi:sodium-dependent dicarboxylate transporter 2/3/5
MTEETFSRKRLVGFVGGPVLFAVVLWIRPRGLSSAGAAVLASTLWIAAWWTTEAVPIPVTSLLPLVLFPALGVSSPTAAAAPYADPIVFLFLGGFLLALAIERWGLHQRVALAVLSYAGDDAARLLFAFMAATAGISMWVSNTATAMMMLPIGTAVVAELAALSGGDVDRRDASAVEPGTAESSPFATGLMLGIAYAASIGGVATLVGTPPNAILAGVARTTLGVQIGFAEWMLFALPLSILFLVCAWAVLLRVYPPETRKLPDSTAVIDARRDALGAMSRGERRTLAVFALVVAGWVLRPFVVEPYAPAISDSVVAVAGAVLLFVVPVNLRRGEFLLSWDAAERVPWGILLLFGSGFSIAAAFRSSGLDGWVASALLGLRGVDFLVVVLAVATVVVFLTEVTSNSATASLFLPVTASLAVSLAVSPLALMVVVAVSASFAFMLPVATPPNAVVFGSGYVTIPEMVRAGIVLNVVGVVILTVGVVLWMPVVW